MQQQRRLKDLRSFSREELEAELLRREDEEYQRQAEEEERNPDYSKWGLMHRSQGWKPLFNIELEEKYEKWLKEEMFPAVKAVTDISWSIDSYLLHSTPTSLVTLGFDHDEPLGKQNMHVRTLRNLFPTLKDDCFGYKLHSVHKVFEEDGKDYYTYVGMWSLNPHRVYERGAIIGKNYGI